MWHGFITKFWVCLFQWSCFPYWYHTTSHIEANIQIHKAIFTAASLILQWFYVCITSYTLHWLIIRNWEIFTRKMQKCLLGWRGLTSRSARKHYSNPHTFLESQKQSTFSKHLKYVRMNLGKIWGDEWWSHTKHWKFWFEYLTV